VELADTPDLGSGGASRGGSSPSARTSWLGTISFKIKDFPNNAGD
jgi:hypothetical protein